MDLKYNATLPTAVDGSMVEAQATTKGEMLVALSANGSQVGVSTSGAAVTTNSTNVYRVYPGLTASANAVASDILPRTFRILSTHNNANTITYSIGCSVVR